MININGISNEYVLDLNKYSNGEITLPINSSLPCNIFFVSDKTLINASIIASKTLRLSVDIQALKKDGVVVVQNLRKEKIRITIKPNIKESRERIYVFKLGKHTINEKSITFNVISKEDGKTEPWHVSYDGKPISYVTHQTKNKITFTLSTILATEFTSNIQLKQDNSGKVINIKLKHKDNNSVELEKVD